MSTEIQTSQRAEFVDRSPQDSRGTQVFHPYPTTIQTSRIPIADKLSVYVEKARNLDANVIDPGTFITEEPFLRIVRCSSNLLTASQRRTKIVEVLASKRALILQLVKLETLYASLRGELREEEGRDATDEFCKEHYGLGDGCDAESELAIAHMELTFRPLNYPGLDNHYRVAT